MDIPNYPEISVKRLHYEAQNDPTVDQFLPNLDKNQGKLPERAFFFGILATVKSDYLKLIISEAHKARLKVEVAEGKSEGILMKEHWFEELNKYLFLSSILFHI